MYCIYHTTDKKQHKSMRCLVIIKSGKNEEITSIYSKHIFLCVVF